MGLSSQGLIRGIVSRMLPPVTFAVLPVVDTGVHWLTICMSSRISPIVESMRATPST